MKMIVFHPYTMSRLSDDPADTAWLSRVLNNWQGSHQLLVCDSPDPKKLVLNDYHIKLLLMILILNRIQVAAWTPYVTSPAYLSIYI